MRGALALAISVCACGPSNEVTPGARGPYPNDQPSAYYPPNAPRGLMVDGDGTLIARGITSGRGFLSIADTNARTIRNTSVPIADAAVLSAGRLFVAHKTSFVRTAVTVISAYDASKDAAAWRTARSALGEIRNLLPSPDGTRLAVWFAGGVELLDTATGESRGRMTNDDGTLLVTPLEGGVLTQNRSKLSYLSWKDGTVSCTITLPPVIGMPSASAKISPTRVAIGAYYSAGTKSASYSGVVDLAACAMEKLLPGMLDGVHGSHLFTVIDRDAPSDVVPTPSGLTTQWNILEVETAMLLSKVIPIPSAEYPQHAWAPDGAHGLFYWTHSSPQEKLRVLDVASGALTLVTEPGDQLVYSNSGNPTAFSLDSSRAFVVTPHNQLASIDLPAGKISYAPLPSMDKDHSPAQPAIAVIPKTGLILLEDPAEKGALALYDPKSLSRVATLGP